MIIDNLELFFDRQEGANLFFITSSGHEIAMDEKLLSDFSDKKQKLFFNLDSKKVSGQAKDVLNEILEIKHE